MNAARIPAEYREMADNGYDIETYCMAKRFLSDRGITVRYLRNGEYMLGMVNPTNNGGPHHVTAKMGVVAFIEYLDAPSTLLAMFAKYFQPRESTFVPDSPVRA